MRPPDVILRRRADIRISVRPDELGRDWNEVLLARKVRREIYGATSPRIGLCDFDAAGMDIMEGRA
jgi:hypothetical protein